MTMDMISRRTRSIAGLAGEAVSFVGGGAKTKTSASRIVAQRLDRIAIVVGNPDRLARVTLFA